jgi:hypothetical protein
MRPHDTRRRPRRRHQPPDSPLRFARQLGEQLVAAPAEELEMLAADRPVYRCDRLLELGADLADLLGAYDLPLEEPGHAGESAIRMAALAVAQEAALIWGATCGHPSRPEEATARWGWPEQALVDQRREPVQDGEKRRILGGTMDSLLATRC